MLFRWRQNFILLAPFSHLIHLFLFRVESWWSICHFNRIIAFVVLSRGIWAQLLLNRASEEVERALIFGRWRNYAHFWNRRGRGDWLYCLAFWVYYCRVVYYSCWVDIKTQGAFLLLLGLLCMPPVFDDYWFHFLISLIIWEARLVHRNLSVNILSKQKAGISNICCFNGHLRNSILAWIPLAHVICAFARRVIIVQLIVG